MRTMASAEPTSPLRKDIMVQHLIVPIDDSPESWSAFDVALALARRIDADVVVVQIEFDPVHRRATHDRLRDGIDRHAPLDAAVSTEVRVSVRPIGEELVDLAGSRPGSMIVMASHGRGRSAAIVGSVTEDVLRRSPNPTMLVGPHVSADGFGGPIVTTVDGSDESELALPIAAEWADALSVTPWIVAVAKPATNEQHARGADAAGTGYLARLARGLDLRSGGDVEYDELHGEHPARDIADYSARHGASLIVASSHGRSGLSRLTLGSVVSGIVRQATCPVIVIRAVDAEPTQH